MPLVARPEHTVMGYSCEFALGGIVMACGGKFEPVKDCCRLIQHD